MKTETSSVMKDFQQVGQANFEAGVSFLGQWSKRSQAITAEWADYNKRVLAEGTSTLEKMSQAKSLEQVFELQSQYSKRLYDNHVAQLARFGTLYADLASEMVRPFEKLTGQRH